MPGPSRAFRAAAFVSMAFADFGCSSTEAEPDGGAETGGTGAGGSGVGGSAGTSAGAGGSPGGGAFAGVAGIAIATLLQSSDGNAGLEYVLISLAAVALGGTPIGGGRGGLLGAIVGAAAIFLVQNLLSALHVNAYWLQVVYGAMLIVGCIIGAQLAAPRRTETA